MKRPASIDCEKEPIFFGDDEKLSRVAAFYGANAAGKSNFLGALVCLRKMVTDGRVFQDNYVSQEKVSSSFSISFMARNGLRYSYNIEVLEEEVIGEELVVYKTNQPTNILKYSKDGGKLELGVMFKDDEKTAVAFNFERNHNQPVMKQLEKSDSKEARAAYEFFEVGLFMRFGTGLDSGKLAYMIEKDQEVHGFINSALVAADLGIESVSLVEAETGANKKQQEIISQAMVDLARAGNPNITEEEIENIRRTSSFAEKIKKAVFQHRVGEGVFDFDVEQESDGTIAASGILLDLLLVLRAGCVYIVDEMDRSLHPSVVAQIVNVFNDPKTNPNNAQLIFTTHDVSLLDSTIYGENILDRDEVWFVEKDLNGCSAIYPLYSIKYETRKEDNMYKKYVGGRYGATPRVSLPYIVELYWERTNEKRG